MKSVSKNNYPEWIVDFFDKNLNEDESVLLMEFLAQDETAFEEFMEYKSIMESDLQDDNDIAIPSFEHLEVVEGQSVPSCEFEAIAYVENDLSGTKLFEVEKKSETDKSFQKAVTYYRLTKLIPEAVITPDFDKLKKKPRIFTLSSFVYAAASAAAALLIYFAVPVNKSEPNAFAAISAVKHEIDLSGKDRGYDTIISEPVHAQMAHGIKPVNENIQRKTEYIEPIQYRRIKEIPVEESQGFAYIDDIRTDYLVTLKAMQHDRDKQSNLPLLKKSRLQDVADFFGISRDNDRIKDIENIADKGLYAYQFLTGK